MIFQCITVAVNIVRKRIKTCFGKVKTQTFKMDIVK